MNYQLLCNGRLFYGYPFISMRSARKYAFKKLENTAIIILNFPEVNVLDKTYYKEIIWPSGKITIKSYWRNRYKRLLASLQAMQDEIVHCEAVEKPRIRSAIKRHIRLIIECLEEIEKEKNL